MKTTDKIWVNGVIHSADTPIIPVTDRGFTLGDGLFETIKVFNGMPCHLQDHFARIRASAKVLSLPLPYEDSTLNAALFQLIKINGILDGAARLTLTRGEGARGLALPETQTPLCVLSLAPGLTHVDTALTLGLSQIRRNSSSLTSAHKTLSYIDNIAARLHQQGNRHYDDVVMLDETGALASTSCANLFWWDDNGLYTPALKGAVLPGTVRARVLSTARALGLDVHEDRYEAEAILQAKGAFITNALIGKRHLAGLDFAKKGKASFDQNPPAGLMAQLLSRSDVA